MSAVLSSCPPRKRQLAAAARGIGAIAVATAWERRRPSLRIVNLHSVPGRFKDAFADLVRELSLSWTFALPSDLPELLTRRVTRSTLLFCFDDGLVNTIEHAAPILEQAGTRAIFAVPAAWPDISENDRARWFREHVYPVSTELHERPKDIAAPTWSDLRELIGRGHEVWSHGLDHLRLTEDTSDHVLAREIVESKLLLERHLGAPVRGYCPPVGHSVPERARSLIAATYDFAFGGRPARVPVHGEPHQIPRSNIEVSWPLSAVELQLSPIGDAASHVLDGLRS